MIPEVNLGDEPEACECCGESEYGLQYGKFIRAMYDEKWLCPECYSLATMED